MSSIGNVSQVQGMASSVVQFGKARSESNQQNVRHIEVLQEKQQNVASSVVDNAIESRSDAADLKGRIIDVMV